MTYSGKIADSGLLLIEFDAENPNIFALQTAISCKRSLEAVSRFAGFGPIAQKALGETLKANLKPKVPA